MTSIDLMIRRVQESIDGRNEVIKKLYTDSDLKSAVIGTLISKGCDKDKAEDHFTDAVVSFIKGCYRPGFSVTNSLTNYMIGIAKNIWLREVTKSNKQWTTKDIQSVSEELPHENLIIEKERGQLLNELLARLDATCQKVLTLWTLNKRMKEIAGIMNYRSEGMARKKKHSCLQKLYVIVNDHPHIKQLLSKQ